MNFYNFQSIVGAKKVAFQMRAPSESFYLAAARQQPYIEPAFEKVEFHAERPQVILVSAVGANGKDCSRSSAGESNRLAPTGLGKTQTGWR